MKAVVLGTDEQYRLSDGLPEPSPAAGEVAIRVAYAGIQWGDVLVRDGHFPVPRPFVPGFEAAGRIVAVGEGVPAARVGEEVLALVEGGAYAEVVVAPEVLAVPTGGVSARDAAGLGWAAPTAYDLVGEVGRVREGDSVLVHSAAGGVGTFAVQFARAAGAARVVGVAGGKARAEHAAEFGYDELVDRGDFPAALDGRAFDVILDPVGGAARTANVALLAPHGRLAVYGNLATFEPVEFSANDLLMRGTSVLTYNSSLLSRTHPARFADSVRRVLELVASGAVRTDVTAEYGLADAATAVRRLAAGETYGRSLLRVS